MASNFFRFPGGFTCCILTMLVFIIGISSCFKLETKWNKYNVETDATSKQNCTCVPFYQCTDDTGEIIIDGKGLLDYRKFDSPCRGYFDVCCNMTKDLVETTIEPPEHHHGCGFYHNGISSWSGVLLFQEHLNSPQLYKCGFSLIHQQVGLTAAHCVHERKGIFSVQIGNTLRTISHISRHPHFNYGTLHNDIALLVFAAPIPLTPEVNTICIPPPGTLLDHTNCLTVSHDEAEPTPRIEGFRPATRTILVPVVPRDYCLEALRTTRLGSFFRLHRSFLCAGGGRGEDTCGGNGGNALVCPIPGQVGRLHQAGIVSWGIGCGEDAPGVYVNVGLFRAWIDKEMTSRGFDVTSYRY